MWIADRSERISTAVYMLVTRNGEKGGREFLLSYNERWKRYNFVAGHVRQEKPERGNWQEAAKRELLEELGLKDEEYRLVPLHDVFVTHRPSGGEGGKLTLYVFKIFFVLLKPEAKGDIEARWSQKFSGSDDRPPELVWASLEDLKRGAIQPTGLSHTLPVTEFPVLQVADYLQSAIASCKELMQLADE